MRKRVWGVGGTAVAAAGIAMAAVFSTSGAAVATTTLAVTESCKVDEPLTGDPFDISTTFEGTAPLSVTKGSVLTGSGVSQPWTVPSELNGVPVIEIQDYALTLRVSGPATVSNATISGGSNLGTGTPSITRNGNDVTVNVPGPLAPGSIVELPTVNFTLRAGTTTGTITTSLTGSGYDDPGIRVTGVMEQGADPLVAPASCYSPDTGTLTSTLVR
ncbi:hypothetical protein AB0M28_08635 [Streptomyces sp. NPDC051940]|uniref:hypothetical protein n=1 Tax=Streptomyces sp. NPDC051940 TaxID=3155675 RepID=UPI003434C82E